MIIRSNQRAKMIQKRAANPTNRALINFKASIKLAKVISQPLATIIITRYNELRAKRIFNYVALDLCWDFEALFT